MEKKNIEYVLTLRLKKEKVFFGPGVQMVLKLVEETGSLSNAAKKMEMSYNKAWRIVQEAEEVYGKKLVKSNTGGQNGGGTALTKEGAYLLRQYEAFHLKVRECIDECFHDFF